ncbi:MAG: DUF2079 domain-containing protein [Leptolyngbya sp. DLM2.Bin27]|nr:MAG: DUF2079 domain-containing protein [Leptolyngbya sp. DLM2.Bin27]
MKLALLPPLSSATRSLGWVVVVYAVLLFLLSSLRHGLFQSGALDLGYHDQILYLLSIGQPPIVSFWGYHFLGGHAEWIYYGLALIYRIYADVHWLLAIQALSLAIALWPLLALCRQAGLTQHQSWTVGIAYLLYPLVFNINLFDFHPEVMAVPLIFAAVLAARGERPLGFAIATTLILGCRASLSLLLITMGLWLVIFECRRWYGVYAIAIGSTWFLIVTQLLIPFFKPDGHHALSHYGSLGSSLGEVMRNALLRPDLLMQQLFTLANLEYLVLLLVPLIWGLSWRHLTPLVGSASILGLNLLSDSAALKNIVFQYSLPILPFLLLAVIAAQVAGAGWLRRRRWIVLWCLIAFAALARYPYFWGDYLSAVDTWSATRQAIAQIDDRNSVLTTHSIVPHLTHRVHIDYTTEAHRNSSLNQYAYVLLNLRHPAYGSSPELAHHLLARLQTSSIFELKFSQAEVYLFIQPLLLAQEIVGSHHYHLPHNGQIADDGSLQNGEPVAYLKSRPQQE